MSIGKVIPIDLNEEMKQSYLEYAMSVIAGRALPDVRDGLKPVQRRILYAMHDLGLTAERPHRKSAYVVGEVLRSYHPHGDAAVYDALVRLAQDFVCRYPLVDGHGNFGSVDGDAPAAMRYTEVRLARLASAMLADIDRDTVDFVPNYDGTTREPVVLPARVPNLLVNGSSGIAVGMATSIPPHNLGEVIDGVIMLIDHPEATVADLMTLIPGPDFPTGAKIIGQKGIREAYETGRGTVRMRARATVERSGGKTSIVITEIPYQVNKARLVERIAELVREKKIDGVTDLRDESDRQGLRIVLELRRDANPRVLLNRLYKHSQLEETFGVIMLALVDGQPRVLTLREMLWYFLEHQKEVVTRRTGFLLRQAEERAHIVDGLLLALARLDDVIATIRAARNVDAARRALMSGFDLSERQADAILEMRLQRLTALERDKLHAEARELATKIAELRGILADPNRVLAIIKEELAVVKEKYADPRRTVIEVDEGPLAVEDLIPDQPVAVMVTHQGYIKRTPVSAYRSQHRGGRGVMALEIREEDAVRHFLITSTLQELFCFTNLGKVYRLRVHEIPEAGRQSKGTAVVNLLHLGPQERITAVLAVRILAADDRLLVLVTRQGLIKRVGLAEFAGCRRDGLRAITLSPDDELVDVKITDGRCDLLMCSANGYVLRFREEEVRVMGRGAAGVRGMRLISGDRVAAMAVPRRGDTLLLVTAEGYGKRVAVHQFTVHSRGGRGIIGLKSSERSGPVVAARTVPESAEVILVSGQGSAIRLKCAEIPLLGRAARGVLLMRLAPGDTVVSVAVSEAKGP
ncbi:MAG: DNA gyrase subunit A [Desulfotomaculales bacterium]